MLLWPALLVVAVSLFLSCAQVTVDDYYSYETFSIVENETTEEQYAVLASVFDLDNYVNVCNGNETNDMCNGLQDVDGRTCGEFQGVVAAMMEFACTLSENVADGAETTSVAYLTHCKKSGACAQSVDTVETLRTALQRCNSTEQNFLSLINIIQNIQVHQGSIGPMNETLVWYRIVEEQERLINNLEVYVNYVEELLYFLNENNLTNIFLTEIFSTRTNLLTLEDILEKQKAYLPYCQEKQAMWQKIDFVRYDFRLASFLIIFIVGLTGNIILLTVFIKYPDMRTIANLMLINLSVVDCICLVFNLPLTYVKTTLIWRLEVVECQVFYFLRYITICVSTYSVVMISIQRFLAVTRFPTATGCTVGEKTKTAMMLSGTWFLGILYSLPRLLLSELSKGMCSDVNDDVIGLITTCDFVIICVIPTIVMTTFTCLTAKKIKESVSNPTGERAGQEQLRQNRIVSANVLTVLAVLFVVSYFPSFLLYFVRYQLGVVPGDFDMFVIDAVTYILQFTNSCLNPIALCIMSRKYRNYFVEILSCFKVPLGLQKPLATSDTSVATTQSSI